MKIRRFAGYIAVVVLLIVTTCPAWSQVPVDISKEKVVISGTQYYVHQVRKGQTTFSIARAYGITVQEITAENPPALYGLKEGQILRIPVRSTVSSATAQQNAAVKDESRYSYHVLKRGETIYSLSKMYGISESEIVRSNPGMDITKLSVGAEIAIPRKDFMPPKEKLVQQDNKYIYHKVEKGETLTSIAEKYGVPLRVLRRENRNMRYPKVGDFVKVPANIADIPEPVEAPVEDTVQLVVEEPVIRLERPEGYTVVSNLKGTLDVAVLLPFYLDRNSNRYEAASVKTKKRLPEEWIFPQSLYFVELYNGILLAADTLSSLGLRVNIHTWDITDDTVALVNLIRSNRLAEMDLIIGPVYSRNLQILAPYAAENEIPVVSPVPLMNNRVLDGNPTLFMANSSLEAAQEVLSREIAVHNNSNMVFIHTDTTGKDADVLRYKELIFNQLNQKMNYEDIRFRELIFYSRSAFGNDSINRISHTLSENMPNIVIIASEDPPVVSEIMTVIHGLSKRFDVQAVAYPSLVYIDNLDPRIFFELNQLVFSPYNIDYSSDDVEQFNLHYWKKFLAMPPETSFAWMGYDIAYYFISGLAMHGKELMNHPELHNPALLQNEFDFVRKSQDDGFENHKLFKIRYSKDYEIRIEN